MKQLGQTKINYHFLFLIISCLLLPLTRSTIQNVILCAIYTCRFYVFIHHTFKAYQIKRGSENKDEIITWVDMYVYDMLVFNVSPLYEKIPNSPLPLCLFCIDSLPRMRRGLPLNTLDIGH